MTVNQNPHYKMRLPPEKPPTQDEMEEALSEAAAITMALDEVGDDDYEREELETAHRKAVGRIRLNLYRLGRDPNEEFG